MAYTPDPERGKRCTELRGRIDERLRQYRPGMDRAAVTRDLTDITGLSVDEVEAVFEYEVFFEYAASTDPEDVRVAAELAASELAEKAVYGFNVL